MLNSYMYNLPDSGQAAVAFSDCLERKAYLERCEVMSVLVGTICLSVSDFN